MDTSDTSVTASWTLGFDGFSPVTHIEIKVFQGNTLTRGPLSFSPSQQSARVTGLEPSSNYSIILYVVNAVGGSTPIQIRITTLHFGELSHKWYHNVFRATTNVLSCHELNNIMCKTKNSG